MGGIAEEKPAPKKKGGGKPYCHEMGVGGNPQLRPHAEK